MMMKFLLNALLLLSVITALRAQDKINEIQQKPLLNFDRDKPLFLLQREQLSNENKFFRYSALTGYREGVAPISGPFNSNFKALVNKEKGSHRIVMYNLSIQDLFTHGLRPSYTVVLEVKDPSKYSYDPKYGDQKEWLRKNGWCYELMMPVGTIKGIKIVEEELERFFNVKCFTDRRVVKILVPDKNGNQKEELKEMDVLVIKEL